MDKCPGREQKFKASDVLEVQCPGCDESIEFFGDEQQRKCRKCGQLVVRGEQETA